MNTRLRRCLAVFGAAIVTVTLASSPGYGAEEKIDGPEGSDPITDPVPGDFRSWDDLFAAQEQLNTAADTITNARDEQKDEGFSGVTAAPEQRRVVLYWRGPVPPRVQEAVKEAGRTAPVAVVQSRYSEQELLDEGQTLQSERAVTGVAPNADGSGLSISVSVSEEEARALPAIKALRVQYVIFPFQIADALFHRQADIPPYWGGAHWYSPSRRCSTGFAIRLGGTSAILGSGHCGKNSEDARINGGALMGPITNKNALRDTLAIRTHAAGRIYSGGVVSNLSIPVKGRQSSYVGNYTCNSGAFTGLRCVSRVTSVNNLILTDVGFMFPMVRATSLSGAPAAGRGDSGGPVISYVNYALQRIALGKGTISAGSGRLGPCGISSQCYRTVYYADLTKTLTFYGATLQLG